MPTTVTGVKCLAAETTITKLATGIVHHEFSTTNQKVKDQDHRVTKCKKAIEWPALVYALYRVSSL